MAVEFTGGDGQGIAFQSTPLADNLTNKTISFMFNADAFDDIDTLIKKYSSVSTTGWFIDEYYGVNTGKIAFTQWFSGTAGTWNLSAAPSTGAWHNLIITYNSSATANDPGFYLDGGTVAITEAVTPIGTVKLETNAIEVGYDSALSNVTIDGKLQDVRIYNRILSLAEVQQLYYSKCQNVVLNGLVFWAPLNGAAGISSFEGATLGASNYVRDVISGAIGTPVGNPLGAGNTIQRIR